MQRIDESDEAKRAERRRKNREANKRWREKNRERVNELNRQWRARNRERVREANRQWRKGNPEKARANYQKWRDRNREKVREAKRRWRAKGGYRRYYWRNRERCLERIRAYHARLRAIRQQWPAFGELRKAALLANETYATVHAAVPTGLPAWLRDDIISEVVLSILEGRAALSSAAAEAEAALRRHRRLAWRELSLNAPAIDGGIERIGLLRAAEEEGARE